MLNGYSRCWTHRSNKIPMPSLHQNHTLLTVQIMASLWWCPRDNLIDNNKKRFSVKWRYDRRSSSSSSNLSNCESDRNKIWVLLSYEEPQIGSTPICWVHFINGTWNEDDINYGFHVKWWYYRPCCNSNLRNYKLTWKKKKN